MRSRHRTTDIRDAPAYGLAEAAHHVRLPQATLRSWVLGRFYESRGEKREFAPLIRLADPGRGLLSFSNLVEAHVLRALRTDHGVQIKALRSAQRYAERSLEVRRLLLSEELRTHGGELFLDRYGELINLTRSGQLAMKAVLEAHLRRVQWDEDGLPGRLYPFLTSEQEGARHAIAIDPRIAFGRPVLSSRFVSTQVITDRIDAGESVQELAADYGVSPEDINQAVVYQRAA